MIGIVLFVGSLMNKYIFFKFYILNVRLDMLIIAFEVISRGLENKNHLHFFKFFFERKFL